MRLARFVVAASAIAITAGTVSAQTTTNVATAEQVGDRNNHIGLNDFTGNDQNRSSSSQIGFDNSSTVVQIGDFNVSQLRAVGNQDVAAHSSEGNFDRTETFQNGISNRSAIRQRGDFNSGTVDQQGNRNLSQISQGAEAGATTDFDSTSFFVAAIKVAEKQYTPVMGVSRPGDDNRAMVSQIGDDLSSTIRQRAASGSSLAAGSNSTSVTQRGQFNSSNVVQEIGGNSVTVYQFQGGTTAAAGNSTNILQRNTSATSSNNLRSNNRADVSVAGQSNSGTIRQNGMNNFAQLSQGRGALLTADVTQTGTGNGNRVVISQAGNSNSIVLGQASTNASATLWQQEGPAATRNSNNSIEVQQGTGTTGSAAFSAAFFNNAAPVTGDQSRNLTADVTQGNNPERAIWNVAQVRQDGVDLAATVRQGGSGTAALPNIVRIGQQGGSAAANSAIAIQGAGVGPSSASDVPTGLPGDEFYFAGGARSAEITILQSGSGNSATVEQRGRGQVARIEQGPGNGNLASILQDVAATNATAIIRQSGSNNSYDINQITAGAYISISQTGNSNAVITKVQRP